VERVSSNVGILSDYTDKPLEYIQKFLITLRLVFAGSPKLLVRNPRILSPPIYLAACVALGVAITKSAWSDDPIKTFDNPDFFKPIEPFLNLVPPPLFAVLVFYIAVINLPMYCVSKALRYNARIPRIIAASSYSIATSLLLLPVLLFCSVISYELFPALQGRLMNFWALVTLAVFGALIVRSFKLLGIAHGMSGYKFFGLNFVVSAIPLAILDVSTEPTSAWRLIEEVANPRPIKIMNVPSGSMRPTLPVGTVVLINRLLPTNQIRIGDVVVFYLPKDLDGPPYIKRIVGMGGDRIQMIDGVLNINGQPVKRERVADYVYAEEGERPQSIKRWRETLPNDVSHMTLDLVDNGFYDNTPIYKVPERHLFMMGDNRDNSTDSRVPSQVGYVPIENIIGKAYFLLYPMSMGYIYKTDTARPYVVGD
jgi:signal peptidase I